MHTAQAVRGRLYRPGSPFTAAELQSLASEGALRPVLGDVFAPAAESGTRGTRARAARALLGAQIRSAAVLCGETAAWVHLGRPAPQRIHIIAPDATPRPNLREPVLWQVHKVPLNPLEQMQAAGMALTTPERTAEDIFLGVGTMGTRRPADRLVDAHGWLREDLLFWPSRAGEEDDVFVPGEDEQRVLHHRLCLIGRLLEGVEDLEGMAARMVERTKRSEHGEKGRAGRIAELLDQCISRRLPTVRYTS
ncbi:hypothetical protein [Nesterenkonia populi]